MKTKSYILFTALMIISVSSTVAQRIQKAEIKVSVQCDMCKERIEKAMSNEKGVRFYNVDLIEKTLYVEFDTSKTDIGKIRITVSKQGYEADEVAADPKAYANLPACCKKPSDHDHIHH